MYKSVKCFVAKANAGHARKACKNKKNLPTLKHFLNQLLKNGFIKIFFNSKMVSKYVCESQTNAFKAQSAIWRFVF